MNINEIKTYYEFRGMKWPSGKEAIDFAITEIGESMDAYIRTNQPGWTRNNPDKEANVGWELADTFQMLAIAAHELTGKTLDELLQEKWASKGYECVFKESHADTLEAENRKLRDIIERLYSFAWMPVEGTKSYDDAVKAFRNAEKVLSMEGER